MRNRIYAILLLVVLLSSMPFAAAFAQDTTETPAPPQWEYEGETGPEHWGELAPEFVQCIDGTAQSPIDIVTTIDADLTSIEIAYNETALNIFNPGHTIQVNVDSGSTINYNGIDYELLQFHFHRPSEHTINGEAAEMELHFVHRDPDSGTLAVIGVLLNSGEADNAAYADIFANLPAPDTQAETAGISIDLNALLPDQQTYYTYQGSLTTPPCSEIVRWLLLDTPVTLSEGQIEAFAAFIEHNARPVQQQHNRDVLHDTNG